MNLPLTSSRREWLKLLLAAAAALPACRAPRSATALVDETISALCDRLLPDDRELAGARRAGAAAYVVSALRLAPYARLSPLVDRLVEQLDRRSRERCGRAFAAASAADQDALTHAFSAGTLGLQGVPEPRLFALLLSLTCEGFACDPGRGGNRDELGWKAMGLGSRHHHAP